MKEIIRVRVQYDSRQQCCKTHKRPLPLPYIYIYNAGNVRFSAILTDFIAIYPALLVLRQASKLK